MKWIVRTLPLIALLSSAVALHAQEISFTASVDRKSIAVGEHIRLTVTLTNAGDRFGAPDLGGLVVVGGPSYGSNMVSTNGRMSVSVSRTWLLTGTAPGKYTIGAAKASVGGGTLQTEPITIEVMKAGSRPSDASAAQGQRSDPNLFVTVSLSKSKGYVGEQVLATYTLYNRYAALELTKFELPKLNGFWSEEIDIGESGWSEQVVNGIGYRVAVLKKQLLFPQRSGKLRVEPMELTCIVNRSFFNRGSNIDLKSSPVEFTAIPLPSGAPADFGGAVGELELFVQADRTSVKANEAIEIVVRVSGRSNLKLLDAPKLEFPGDFEAYDPKVVDKISLNASGMSGSREFQYTVIPRHDGHFDLGTVDFSYFDTRTNAYKSLASDPIVIDVAPGEGGPASNVHHPSKSDVVTLAEEVRYIRTGDLGLREKGHFLFASLPWFAGMGTPALAFLLFLVWKRKRERERGDVEGTRRKRAEGVARKRLREADQALQQGERQVFYAALSKALHGYLSDKFNLGVAEVNMNELRLRFASYADGNELADGCARMLTACDMARFAPVEDKPRRELYEEAAQLIQRIERSARA